LSRSTLCFFLVSIEPYLFYLNITFDLASHEIFLNYSSILYALDMTALMIILGLFTDQLAREESGLVATDLIATYKRVRNVTFLSAALFAVTILPMFWVIRVYGQPIRFYFWFIPLFLSLGRRTSVSLSDRRVTHPKRTRLADPMKGSKKCE